MLKYRSALLSALLAVTSSCGDNSRPAAPPDAPPDGDPGACRLDLAADALTTGSWDPRFTIPGLTRGDGVAPMILDFARDVDGSIVATGEFSYAGGDRVEPLMRLSNGTWQPARTTWEITPPGAGFAAVAIAPDGTLALATFDDFGPRSGEIWIDEGSGLRKIAEFDGLMRRLAWFDDKLWAAGFHQIESGTTSIPGLAVWDGATWSPPPGGAPTGAAFELVRDGDELLVGGSFDQIGGIAAQSVAAFDGTTWRALSFPTEVAIYGIARGADNELYAGGALGIVSFAAGGIARWTGTTWVPVSGGLGNGFNAGVVTDLVQHDGSLFASGCFMSAGGGMDDPGAVTAPGIARYDGAWHAVGDDALVLAPWYEPKQCGDEGPDSVWGVSRQVMFSAGDKLLLGGSFPGMGGVLSQSLVSYDGSAWGPEGAAGGLGIAGSLDKLGVSASGCELWGVGQLTHAAGARTGARVLRFTGDGWTAIEDPLPADAFCPGFAVSAAGDAALGCMIFPPKGDAVGRLYRASGSQLVQVGPDMPLIHTLAYDADGTLWIGGGSATGFVGRLEGESLAIVEDGFDAPVQHIDPVAANDVIVAGLFAKVGTLDAANIARWNGTTWSALGAGVPGAVTAVAHDATTIYVSTVDQGSGAYLLGAFDGTSWKELATPAAGITPAAHFNFNALEVIDGAVIGVGAAALDDGSARGALVFRDGTFRGLGGGGVHGITLNGLAVTHDTVWAGGLIAEASNGTQATPSVGIARWVITR